MVEEVNSPKENQAIISLNMKSFFESLTQKRVEYLDIKHTDINSKKEPSKYNFLSGYF